MSSLTRTTHTYAVHQIPLQCDVYEQQGYPPDTPVLLHFHSRALTAGSRRDIPPWLAQTCIQHGWPLVSASYRLLPQADSSALLEDASAAYAFARKLGGGTDRSVIVSGASAGFFMAAMTAHHLNPKPLALLSITGIPTFRHPHFNSSTTIPDSSPLSEEDVKAAFASPLSVGSTPLFVFDPDMLLPSSAKNPNYQMPSPPTKGFDTAGQNPYLGSLFSYFVRENAYLPRLADIDPGYDWAATAAADPAQRDKLAQWPVTIFIQGDADTAVPLEVCGDAAKALGEKGRMFVAKGEGHLFENGSFLEEQGPGMDAVRQAIDELHKVVGV